jgi:hypothetical protein
MLFILLALRLLTPDFCDESGRYVTPDGAVYSGPACQEGTGGPVSAAEIRQLRSYSPDDGKDLTL